MAHARGSARRRDPVALAGAGRAGDRRECRSRSTRGRGAQRWDAGILREGEHALFFDIDDVDGCTEALLEVVRNPEVAAERAERARTRAAEFRHDRYHEATDAFLEDTLRAYGVSPSATARATAASE